MSKLILRGLPLVFVFTYLAIPSSQTAEAKVLEEVVVTARRRSENLQETPISVSALGSDFLEEMGVDSVEDIETLTPSLQFSQTNFKAPAIFIRGIGQRSGNPVLDPGVGIYLNGVYIPRSDAQLLDAVDVANIQVLRGPQGTLFGKNNIGGALLVDSKKPNPEALEYGFSAELGNYGRKNAKANANIPLVEDKVGLRLAVNSKRSDGYIDNVFGGNSLFDEDRQAISARTVWFVNEEVELDFFTFFSKIDERGTPYNCNFQNPDAILTQAFYRGEGGQDLKTACDESSELGKKFQVAQNPKDALYSIDNQMYALTLKMPIGKLDFESITSYAEQDNIGTSGDSDGTSAKSVHVGSNSANAVFEGAGQTPPSEERKQFTQEIKFNGTAFDDRLNYTFGVFYSKEQLTDSLDGTDVGDNGLVAVGPNSAGLPGGIPLPNDTFVLPVQANTASAGDYENITEAVFAQATYEITDWLQFTLGIRYTEEKRSSAFTQYLPNFEEYATRLNDQIGSDPAITTPVGHVMDGIYSPVSIQQYFAYTAPEVPLEAEPTLRGSTTFSETTPAATLNFIATDDLLETLRLDSFIAYMTYSKGFKSGGLDVRNTQTESNIQQYEPELVTNTELGIKFDAFANKLRFNFAVYHLEYTDLQVALYEVGATNTEVIQFTGNAGEAAVDGFEFELTWIQGPWTINANAGYTDGDFVEYNLGSNTPDGFAVIDRSNEAFPQVPQNVRGMVVQYEWESPVGSISPQLQYYYSDEIFIGTDYLSGEYANSTIGQYELFNSRVRWEISDAWSMDAYVNNIKDEPHYVGGIAVTSVIGVANYVPGAPRLFGVGVSYKFQ